MRLNHIVIIGGGFSGTMQAINLLRHDGPRATLIERSARLARGVAYSAAHPSHLLNVRAGNMSAYPDDARHFVNWLRARDRHADGGSFVSRQVYGEYLGEQLQAAVAVAGDRLTIVKGDAVDLKADDTSVEVSLAGNRAVKADAAVLALGNLPPRAPQGLDPTAFGADLYLNDPWSASIGEGLTDDDHVLMLGTGPTMVDAALLLEAQGFRGRITAISRRGLQPRVHDEAALGAPLVERPATVVSKLLADVRAAARTLGWRAAVDQLRPHAHNLWLAANADERRRFLRHLRPWWDVHRHRLAPEVDARIAAMHAHHQLAIAAGKTVSFTRSSGGVAVRWRPRGQDGEQTLQARRIINCTGPQCDVFATREPLLRRMLSTGLIRPDAGRLGLDVDVQGRLIGADGRIGERLFALGPMTRGTFWEITAVPDIRQQTWSLARRLANAHWVSGEGL